MMNPRILKTAVIALLATAPLASGARPKVSVSLHPAVSTIAPGVTFEVGIQFKVPDGWHIYWQNPGDSGLPPRVDWRLPPGFEVGELRFPVPQRHLDPGNLISNVLEGEPVLLQTLMAPADLRHGTEVTLAADIQWLVCKKQCVREQATVSVVLPVGGPAADLAPVHEAVLRQARGALPLPADKSKYVKVTASSRVTSVRPGQEFDVILDVAVAPGNHIQSNRPAIKSFIATRVFLERNPAVDFGKIVYPPPREHTHPQLGKVSEYRGNVQIRIPTQVRDDDAGARIRVAGVLTTQACSDKTGTCYRPEHVAWALVLPVERLAASTPDSAEDAKPTLAATPTDAPAKTDTPGTDTRVETAAAPADLLNDSPPVESTQTPGPAEAPGELDAASADGDPLQRFLARLGLPGLLLGCFIYGLFINATPCVLPILSIKVLGFVQQAHESRRRTLMLGLAFGAGVMVFFVILGFLAAQGRNVLQSPAAVIALGAVVMALALSMLGVYTLQVPTAATKLEATIRQEGLLASFGKGALAPVLGFACTGPLLAFAFGWATQQPREIAFFAFLVTGLGMASPYMLLGANPNWLGFLPRPGPWMVTFERVMGFLLLAMVIWLLNPLVAQIGAGGLQWTLGFMVVIAMGCWLLGKIDINMSAALRWRYRAGATALVVGTGAIIYGMVCPLDEAVAQQRALRLSAQSGGDASPSGLRWQVWSPEAVEQAVRSGKTVFVDFTAAWCTVCKVNKTIATNTPEVRDRIRTLGIVLFQGDSTTHDPQIAVALQKHGRPGLPLNLIYPAGKPDAPIVLRPNLTKAYLLKKLDEAGPSADALASH